MQKKKTLFQEFTKGLVAENPVLRLMLGICPTLAVTTSMVNAIGMGISTAIVLICSNAAISALRKFIPSKVRIPAYIVLIASFFTVVQLLVKAFLPALNTALGVYFPLIVVNCIIFGRAEAFAGKNTVIASVADGMGMGTGFTIALLMMGTIREVFGNGTIFDGAQNLLSLFGDNVLGGFNGFDISSLIPESLGLTPITIFILPAGGFFVFGILIALSNRIARKKQLPEAVLNGCESCPMFKTCTRSSLKDEEEATS